MTQSQEREGSLSFPLSELSRLEGERRHVEALARIRESEGVADWKRTAAASLALAAAICVAAIVFVFAVVRPDASRRIAVAEASAATQSEELRAVRARAQEAEHKVQSLGVKLDEEARRSSDLAAALEATHSVPATVHAPKGLKGPTAPAAPPAPAGPFGTNCPPGSRDPLCGLPR